MTRSNLFTWAVLLLTAIACCSTRADDAQSQPLQRLSLPTDLLMFKQLVVTNPPAWKSSVTLGLTVTRGNSDTLLATANLQTQRRSDSNEWLLGTDGSYGEDNSVENSELLHGFVQFNHFFTSRFFIFGRLDGLHDGIKDLKYRLAASPGLGYYLLQGTNNSFVVEAGPSLVTEQQDGERETYTAMRLAERFDHRLNSAARLWQTAELIPQVDQTANFIVNAEFGIETVITKDLSLQVLLQDNYVNQPAPSYKNNDFRLVSGLSYKF